MTLKLIRAIIIACIGGVVFWDKPWERFRSAYLLVRNARHEAPVSDWVYSARLKKCGECPIFNQKLETCGSPLSNRDMGCWCFMPYKALLADATCWLNDKTKDHPAAWPEYLQSYGRKTTARPGSGQNPQATG